MCSSSPTDPRFDDLEEEEIRILYLEPGNFEEPLTGELRKASVIPGVIHNAEGTAALSEEESENINHIPTFRFPGVKPFPKARSSVQYEAVSYAWESLEKPHSINIHKKGDVAITDSLFDLLRHFRYTHRHRKLWVDGVCIDQANVSERNHQVAMMADIFSASLKVLVWLGAGASTDSIAFATMDVCTSLLEAFDSAVGTEASDPWDMINLDVLRTALCEYTGSHASFRRDMNSQEDVAIAALTSISTIFEAKWFQRLWVVQETHPTYNIAYFRGYHEMESSELSAALGVLEENVIILRSRDIRIDCTALSHMVDHVTSYTSPTMHGGSIISHFIGYSVWQCHDPRDRVFAFRRTLGLESFDELRPDYQLDDVEVFRKLVCVCLNARDRPLNATNSEVEGAWIEEELRSLTNSALTLALIGTELKLRPKIDWPSWVPDLHELSSASRAKARLYRKEPIRHWSPNTISFEDCWLFHENPLSARVMSDSPNSLQLRGRCFATALEPYPLQSVPDLGPQFSSADTMTRTHVERLAEWFATYFSYVADCVPGVFDMDLRDNLVNFAFYPTMWTSRFWAYGTKLHGDFTHLLDSLVARGTGEKLNLGCVSCDEIFSLAPWWPECPLASERRLWRVQVEGRTDAAWLPVETQAGDDICVIARAPWPFVVRKVDEQSYTLIGDGHIFHTSLMQALGSERQEFEFWPGEPLGFNTDHSPSDEDMTNLSWITLR
jgi:hypothetical protein